MILGYGLDSTGSAQGPVVGSSKNGNGLARSVKAREFLHQQNNC
jgi:hypothetical protein